MKSEPLPSSVVRNYPDPVAASLCKGYVVLSCFDFPITVISDVKEKISLQ